ncbi:hypothetical protein ACFU51_16905 [Streptomyces sp. NPDC057430]|uniref:hypothetical protein n=1 Tax=Streptomyces sp. NPDC057430 TaxID=3346131 RepID=UPI0036A8A44D
MRNSLARLVNRLLRRTGSPHPPPAPPAYTHPYSRPYADGSTRHHTGERPSHGEDSPLVRPYLLAYERRQGRGRVLLFAAHGLELRPDVEVVA